MHWGEHYFPAFNVADIGITIGAILLVIDALLVERGGARQRAAMKILLANPRGFCAGVDRAIDIVERAIELFGAPIYVRHEVVHNRYVVERLREPRRACSSTSSTRCRTARRSSSARTASRARSRTRRARRGLTVFDATCPLVTKVHMEVGAYARDGRDVILIGHAGHPEVEGTMGRSTPRTAATSTSSRTSRDVAKLEVRDPAQARAS